MLNKIYSSEFGKGALILFMTINLYNLINFLFHFSMGRLLGPSDYGILAVLMSMVYVYNVPAEAIQNIISMYTSKFNLKNENGKIKYLMLKSLRKGFIWSSIIVILMILPSLMLSEYLDINFWLIFLTNIMVIFSFLVPIIRGVLQGKRQFSILGFGLIIDSVFKLGASIFLVIIGFKVFGAIAGVLIGVIIGIIFSLYFSREVLTSKEKYSSFKEIYSISIPYFISMLVVLIILSLDIILAKRFFTAEIAGKYSVVSMIGKMVFFGTIAISKAMFPITSEKHHSNVDTSKLFIKAFTIILFLCFISSVVFAIFPKYVIGILYGPQYIDMAPYLIYSGIALSFLSFSNLTLSYRLSTNNLKNYYFLFIFVFVEILLLSFFHKNILEYAITFMISNMVMFISIFHFFKK